MTAVKFNGMNTVYTAPGCYDLPTMQSEDEASGRMTVTSAWKPSEEDLEILNAGGCVCLSVIGGQPPVCLWAQEVTIID